MITLYKKAICAFSIFVFCASTCAGEINYTSWKFSDLTSIGGIPVTPEGNPEIIAINNDKAYLFDGTEDRVLINNNPLIGLDEFTIEVVFRVDKGGVAEQKFVHLQANPDINILFELEFKNDSMWYMDNYIRSGSTGMNFIDSTKLYAANRWYHAALVYKNNEFKQYINYKTEDAADYTWKSPSDGSVSVGARATMNHYMNGAVREIRFADAALDSTQFLFYGELLEQHETFVLDNLKEINGHTVQSFGNPEVVETENGQGIEFDGTDDGIYILTNPIGAAKYFTIETIVKPKDVFPANDAPRYFHIEDADNSNRRITMELRLNDKHEWYFDGFLKASGNESIGLMDETLTHPIDGWEHMAITYDNGIFKTFVNYEKELESNWGPNFLALGANTKMSVGMRMNKVNHFNGIFQRIRITHAVLESSEFMSITPDTNKVIPTGNSEIYEDNSDLNVVVYPNPASCITKIQVMSSTAGHLSLDLYNMAGIMVDELLNGYISAGVTETGFDARLYQKGLYLLQIRNNYRIETQKILIK